MIYFSKFAFISFCYFLIITFFFFFSNAIKCSENIDNPSIVIAGYNYDSPRTNVIISQMEFHFRNIFTNFTQFDYVSEQDFSRFASRTNEQTRETILQVSNEIGITIPIFISLSDNVDHVIIEISAHVQSFPFMGEEIHAIARKIDVSKIQTREQYNLIAEDIVITFSIGLLKKLLYPIKIDSPETNRKMYVLNHAGDYKYFEPTNDFLYDSTYVLEGYIDQVKDLETRFYSKKKELVFPKIGNEERLAVIAASPLVSAVSIFAIPAHYLGTGEYSQIGLWALNTAPYFYLSYDGFSNRPSLMRENEKDISRFNKANYYYMWYHIFAGSTALYANALAQTSLSEAGGYASIPPYFGDDTLAATLTLFSSGTGHFYKGHPHWGYFYYHTGNLLVYTFLYTLASNEKYDSTTKKHVPGKGDNLQIAATLSALGIFKAIEIFHFNRINYRFDCGVSTDTFLSIEPRTSYSSDTELAISVTRRF